MPFTECPSQLQPPVWYLVHRPTAGELEAAEQHLVQQPGGRRASGTDGSGWGGWKVWYSIILFQDQADPEGVPTT